MKLTLLVFAVECAHVAAVVNHSWDGVTTVAQVFPWSKICSHHLRLMISADEAWFSALLRQTAVKMSVIMSFLDRWFPLLPPFRVGVLYAAVASLSQLTVSLTTNYMQASAPTCRPCVGTKNKFSCTLHASNSPSVWTNYMQMFAPACFEFTAPRDELHARVCSCMSHMRK